MSELRKTGIDVLGDIPWGTHFCNFYETKQDLLDTVVPYFKAGLESNEFCLWIISNSGLVTIEEAKEALEQVVPGFDQQLSDKHIEILNGTEWYLEENVFNLEKVINAWHVKLKRALALGHDGMRISGDTFWLNEKIWKDFVEYEKLVNDSFNNLPITLLCTYPLVKSKAFDILDVVHAHQFAIARRQGEWEVIETPELIQAKTEIKRLNEELEQRVVERTRELTVTNEKLRKQIAVRKHAEALLHANEQVFRAIVENAPDHIARYDREFRRTYVNPALARSYGVAAEALIGKPMFSIIRDAGVDIKEDELAPIRKRYADVFETGKSCEFEITLPMPTGRKDYSVRLFPEFDLNDSVIYVLSIARDFTERKQAEDALRRSEDRIRLIIDTIPTMAWSVQPDGTVDFVNQRWLDYTGKGKIEERTRIIHPEDLSRVMEKWLVNKAAGKAFDDEIRLRRADGEYHWFLVRTAPVRDEQGNLVKWYGVSIDIEDSKRAEDELRLAYQRLSFQVENTPLAVIEFDEDLFIKRWSKRAEEIFGWKESEALGKNVYDPHFPIIYEEDMPAVNKINEQLTKGMVNRNLSLNRNNTKDGNVIYSEWYNSVLRDEHGNVITILSLVHDVTERKKAEEELRQINEELHSLSSHLQNVREEERIQIARNIHDDLGQQLTGLKMDVNWLNKKLGVKDEIVKQKMIGMLELIDETLKSVRRISSDLRPSILDDFGLIAALEWHSEEVAKRSEIKVNFSADMPEPDIPVAIGTGIFRIYQELLTNVVRHANAHVISSSLRLKENHIILKVKDDGQGMDPSVPGTKKTLGLIGVKERTFALGGKFDLKSEPGKGTGVQVAIPYKNNMNKP